MKNELRKKYLRVRKNIINRSLKDQIIFNKVINNEKIVRSLVILIYVSMDDEVDTRNLINYFFSIGKKVAVPRVENGIINFYFIESLLELSPGYKGILEPIGNKQVIDFKTCVSITPGICFNNACYRIGYGLGFYDKFYSNKSIYKIGLCYKDCLISDNFNDSYDVSLDEIITD